jgi:alginate O-acetyltransferase complex protein AlgI
MLFNSLHFILFFCIVTPLYFILPHKYRWLLLLIASCYFYMTFVPIYILILLFTIIIDYLAGILIDRSKGTQRKRMLYASIVANLSVLIFYKYFNFLNENITFLLNLFGADNSIKNLSILLPIGLSFHTFQSMSYTIEVYRGNQKPERHFGIFALYVLFYPQLVAGPIERPQNLLHQFYEKHTFNYDRVVEGLKLMLWGFFKKIVIADRLALMVNKVYNHPHNYEGVSLILATVLFTIQIFCDFSGYSDIARGAAKIMGFDLMLNFRRPYHSKSISEFWSRWHISLSTWFKEYLYIPLGGNRVLKWRLYFNIGIVFFISGLWHGASWNFVIWGALHGFYLIFAKATSKIWTSVANKLNLTKYKKANAFFHLFTTYCLVAFAWIFFRANNFKDAIYIVTHLFSNIASQCYSIFTNGLIRQKLIYFDLDTYIFFYSCFAILLLEAIHLVQHKMYLSLLFHRQPIIIKHTIVSTVVLLIIFFGIFKKTSFIYFQF